MSSSRPSFIVPALPAHAPQLPSRPPYPHPLWFEWLADEVSQPYFKALSKKVREAQQRGVVYPPPRDRYAALRISPQDVKVVILGQDPYHGAGQANGLAFSVRPGVRIPPSLANINKELEAEGFGKAKERGGSLENWANQGVLLLNTVLTVSAGRPGSHRGWGWERFTDAIVSRINDHCQGVVFLLWGRHAQQKGGLVDPVKHLILTSPHPSPYSAHTGFFGNGHFKKTNEWLEKQGKKPIVW